MKPTQKNQSLLFVLAAEIAFGIFVFPNLVASKAYACNSGLSRLDPTCPGRILDPQPPTPRPARPPEERGWLYLRARSSRQCLNVLNAATNNGGAVVQGRACDTSNFQWRFLRADGDSYYIQAKHSNQCLNVLNAATNNGAPVVQGARCDTDNFKWTLLEAGRDIDNYPLYYIQAKHSGQCLNVLNSSLDNGGSVVQGSKCDTNNFKWAFIGVR
jgi:Ricin-type beta-trefoil lectin domain-like